MEVGPVKVIALCKPNYGVKFLEADNNKILSSFMPCGIGIYEKRNGKTYVSRRNVKLFAIMFGGELGQAFKKVAEEEDQITSFLR